MSYFVTRSGRAVPEAATDQAGTEMLVRTVSRYTDGTPAERPQPCVSPELAAGDVEAAQRMAADLDRRGYLPPDKPMTRDELAAAVARHHITERYAALLWDVLGRGVPAGTAIARLPEAPPNPRNMRDGLRRLIKRIGWGEVEDPA